MKRWVSLSLAIVLALLPLFTACLPVNTLTPALFEPSSSTVAPVLLAPPRSSTGGLTPGRVISTTPYLDTVNLTLEQVKYWPLVDAKLSVSSESEALLRRNGFVVTDQSGWQRFIESYAWIYWKDLPVLITTDSILHTLHQSYEDLLKDLEINLFTPQLAEMLAATQATLSTQRQANSDPALAPLYEDVALYLAVGEALLQDRTPAGEAAGQYFAAATSAATHSEVTLFGTARPIDFTLFQPRGHYDDRGALARYFRAMSWLSLIDFRMLTYDPQTSAPALDQEQIAAAALLRQAIDDTDQRARWQVINSLLEVLIGRSDNMTLPDFDRFLSDAGLTNPAQALTADPTVLQNLLLQNDYGQQRITGQLIERHINNPSDQPIPRPTSFLLLGQRFALDSFILGELVYDRLMVNGEPVHRALPSPLDVLAALSNDRALTHLQGELTQYQYSEHLARLRQTVDGLKPEFWQAPLYQQWLGLLRTLNPPTTDTAYPQAMRTAAWADKMLQTQLGSWAQLRHDSVLYVKQSFTPGEVTCDYPAGYVEPYPAFFAALQQLAHDLRPVLEAVPVWPGGKDGKLLQGILTYLDNLHTISGQLQTLAEKELRLEEFSAEETLFLQSIIKRKATLLELGCGDPKIEEQWDGWYPHLFYQKDDNPAVVADVHTNTTTDMDSSLYPPRVLHAATGPVAVELLVVDTDEGMTIYVGPAFSYFEVITTGNASQPPKRLTDKEWQARFKYPSAYPPAPDWSQSFRVPATSSPQIHRLPTEGVISYKGLPPNNLLFFPVIAE